VSDLNDLKKLAGIVPASFSGMQPYDLHSNLTVTAQEKVNHQNTNNIQPGTNEWFKLWFSRPYLTGEKPY
jgi:hypothetical protein